MPEVISLKEGARRYGRFVNSLQDAVLEGLIDFHVATLGSQLRDLRDAPDEDEWRSKDDHGPLRIVTARLWQSLVGPYSWQRFGVTVAAPTVRLSGRRYPRKASGVEESLYNVAVTPGVSRVRGTLTFGTKTPYAHIQEFGGTDPDTKRRIRPRPYFYPGVKRTWRRRAGILLNPRASRIPGVNQRTTLDYMMYAYLMYYLMGGRKVRV
ncbi:MAG: hypothetical protein OXH34_01800 [Bacteroidetes bacterium]|nr:hypothetical protein [Bacteroidota bacterium]